MSPLLVAGAVSPADEAHVPSEASGTRVDEDGDITAFVLELPAGAPPDSINPTLGTEQARRYAEDLTRLMRRQRQTQAN